MKATFCLSATVLLSYAANPVLAGIPESTTNLAYTPVSACRIVDTRQVGGSFNNETRAYKAKGTNFASQGGVAGPCGIPSTATAIFVNLAAVNGTQPGFLTAYPWDSSGPIPSFAINFSLVNYSNIAGLNIANGVTVPICNTLTATAANCAQDFFIFNQGSEVIADVIGYFSPRIATSNNIIGVAAAIGGGASNTANGGYSTIGGGENNVASGSYSTVGGGFSNTASGGSSTAGGDTNTASGVASTVSGGFDSLASGDFSIVVGGRSNTTSGAYSFAAGRQAKAIFAGSFVWGDSTNADVNAPVADSFTVRAIGGTNFYTNAALTTGVTLAAGSGSWSTLSDRAVKRNFQGVNGLTLLKKLATLPMARWNYISQDTKIRHIGPMAQDFYKAFGVGEDNKHISTVDAQGVALAAIQALYQQVQNKDKQIIQLKQQQQKNQVLYQQMQAKDKQLEQELGRLKQWMKRLSKP